MSTKERLDRNLSTILDGQPSIDILCFQESNLTSDKLKRMQLPTSGWKAIGNAHLTGKAKGVTIFIPPQSQLAAQGEQEVDLLADSSAAAYDLLVIERKGIIIANVYLHVVELRGQQERRSIKSPMS